MSVSLHRIFESHLEDPFDFRPSVVVSVVCLVVVLVLLSEIHSAREFTYADEVSPFDEFLLERRLVHEAVEGSDRTDVGVESEFFSHREKTLFRTNLRIRVVVEFGVAYRREKHSVGFHANFIRLFRERVADLVDGVSSANCVFITQFVSELLAYGLCHGQSLFHDFGSDAVARQDC